MSTVADYSALITSEHAGKPKFSAWLGLLVSGLVDTQNLTSTFSALYDLDVAVDDRLDVCGQWAGLSRYVVTPITGVYFSWDTSGVGWDQGVWEGPFDPVTGVTRLDDETYRMFIRAKIAANHWDGTIQGYQDALAYVFQGTGTVVSLVDHQDMSMDVVFSGTPPSALSQALITQGYLQLKPTTVHINGYYITSVPGAPIFAWDAPGSSSFAGWDTGAWAVTF